MVVSWRASTNCSVSRMMLCRSVLLRVEHIVAVSWVVIVDGLQIEVVVVEIEEEVQARHCLRSCLLLLTYF